ncbi:MAG: HupE/UreJ family protein, partial [Paracoccaceae bacterium]
MTQRLSFAALIGVLTLLAGPVLAHTGEGSSGFMSGVLHPISGLDHVVAMVAVGLWGGILGKPALWQLPVAFPVIMAVAGALGAAGVLLPGVEVGIALSGIVLGAMVLFAVQVPLWAATAMVGVFAVFHGHAHGAELPGAVNPIAYAAG